jgi:hypothetical protein
VVESLILHALLVETSGPAMVSDAQWEDGLPRGDQASEEQRRARKAAVSSAPVWSAAQDVRSKITFRATRFGLAVLDARIQASE